MALVALNRFDEAAAVLIEAHEYSFNQEWINDEVLNLAIVYHCQGDFKKAWSLYQKVIQNKKSSNDSYAREMLEFIESEDIVTDTVMLQISQAPNRSTWTIHPVELNLDKKEGELLVPILQHGVK